MSNPPAILVTGGAGYIGSHACRALEAAGYQPIVYDNLSTGHRSFVNGPLVVGDLLDGGALARVFARHDIEAVMHFAAASLVGESAADPHKYYVNNVNGTLSLLGAMREAGCRRLAFSSTAGVYGNADGKALSEEHPCAPINTYGATKWMIERILADYRGAYGFGVVVPNLRRGRQCLHAERIDHVRQLLVRIHECLGSLGGALGCGLGCLIHNSNRHGPCDCLGSRRASGSCRSGSRHRLAACLDQLVE